MAIKQDVVYDAGEFKPLAVGSPLLGGTIGGAGSRWVLRPEYKLGTLVTNTTGQSIFAQISGRVSSDGFYISLTVDGDKLIAENDMSANTWGSVTGIIPPGSTYVVEGSVDAATLNWAELVSTTAPASPVRVEGTDFQMALNTECSELASVGYRQTWAQMPKVHNTPYTNTTGRPIAVSLWVLWSGAGGGLQASAGTLKVDGRPVQSATLGYGPLVTGEIYSFFTIVPPGSTYEFDITVPTEEYLGVRWFETTDSDVTFKPVVEGATDLEVLLQGDTTPSASIGIGQMWRDVSSQRAANAVYTNSGERPITISGYGTINLLGAYFEVIVGNVSVMKTSIQKVSGIANPTMAFTTIVPPGQTYVVHTSNTVDNLKWFELS